MGYKAALDKAWSDIDRIPHELQYKIVFLEDKYLIDLKNKQILFLACNTPPKEYICIILLHYLLSLLNGSGPLSGDWVSFKEIPGGHAYYSVFRKRVIGILKRKCDDKPEIFLKKLEKFKPTKTHHADLSIIIKAFKNIPILITYWKGDEEMGSEMNILFDRSIADILCTEDIVVMSEIFAHQI